MDGTTARYDSSAPAAQGAAGAQDRGPVLGADRRQTEPTDGPRKERGDVRGVRATPEGRPAHRNRQYTLTPYALSASVTGWK